MDPLILERGSEVFSLGGDGACAVSVVMVGKAGPGWGGVCRSGGTRSRAAELFSTKKTCPQERRSARVSYRATVDVPIATVRTISGWLTAHRRAYDIRPHQRACTTWARPSWCCGGSRTAPMCGPRPATPGSRRPLATATTREALEVVAQRSPEITDVLDRLRRDDEPFVCLNGTLVRTDRVAARTQASNHLWCSGRHRAFGGNVQALTDHTGSPVWTAPVEPGSTHDITAARTHALPALYRSASLGLPTPADKDCTGAGIGIKVPAKNPHPDPDTRWRNELISSMRAPAERTNALIKHFKALKHATLDPRAITTIAAATVVPRSVV